MQAAIKELNGVESAVVIDFKQGKKTALAAYIVGTTALEDLSKQLAARLPSYMIPSSLMNIQSIPLTSSGKLDRRKLPEPVLVANSGTILMEPKTPQEKQLCAIFADVLELEAIGTTDNFFESGGNSINVVDLVYSINKSQIANLRSKDIYEAPTVCEIIEKFCAVQDNDNDVEDIVEPDNASKLNGSAASVASHELDASTSEFSASENCDLDIVEIVPNQDWWLDQPLSEPEKKKMVIAFTINLPIDQDFSSVEIKKAIKVIADRHDALRCTFLPSKRQMVIGHEAPVSFLDMRETEASDDFLSSICESIDYETGPVWRSLLHSERKLLFVFHQLIFDPLSCKIIFNELRTLLEGGELRGSALQFSDWADYLEDYAEMNSLVQEPFWSKTVGTRCEFLEPSSVDGDNFHLRSIQLSRDMTSILSSAGSSRATTAASGTNNASQSLMVHLLSSLARGLSSVTGGNATTVGLMSMGRLSNNDVDTTESIGWYNTMYPILLDGSGAGDNAADSIIKRVKRTFACTPDQGIGYGVLAKLQEVERYLPDVLFLFEGQSTEALSSVSEDGWGFEVVDGTMTTIEHLQTSICRSLLISVSVDDTGALEVNIMSFLDEERTMAFHDAFACSIDYIAESLGPSKNRRGNRARDKNKSSLRRRSKAVSDGTNRRAGKAQQPRNNKSISAQRLIRNYKLNSVFGDMYMFFVHPGGDDANVYDKLAQDLDMQGFNPKGIDNDVLTSFNDYEMASDLSKLGQYYVDTILKSMRKAVPGSPIHLFGWSLGGKIALEAAVILERLGHKNVFVYALDSFLNVSPIGGDAETLIEEIVMVNKAATGMDHRKQVATREVMLAEQPLSGKLVTTTVTLIKAGKAQEQEASGDSASDERYQRAVEWADNGLSQVCHNLTVVKLDQYDHISIIDARDDIVEIIIDQYSAATRQNQHLLG